MSRFKSVGTQHLGPLLLLDDLLDCLADLLREKEIVQPESGRENAKALPRPATVLLSVRWRRGP